jgi:tellurite resistance protein TerC
MLWPTFAVNPGAEVSSEALYFICFIVFIVTILAVDLGLFSKRDRKMRFQEALIWTLVWIACALTFYFFLLFRGEHLHGTYDMQSLKEVVHKYAPHLYLSHDFEQSLNTYRQNIALEFITGYLIEYALSVDNIFVIILILASFNVNDRYHKRVLFWGILGAIIMRCIFIFSGSALVQSFSWIFYIFGALLVFTGVKMFIENADDDDIDTEAHPVVRFLSKYFSVFPRYVSHHFIIKKRGKIMLTPLFIVLMVIEFTDLIFAVDSIPAIFSITEDPYIIFFSNIFAIIGLRSLFFLITRVMHLFHFLKTGLAFLLTFIGLKMIFHEWLHRVGFTTAHSLYIVLSVLFISILASVIFPRPKKPAGKAF